MSALCAPRAAPLRYARCSRPLAALDRAPAAGGASLATGFAFCKGFACCLKAIADVTHDFRGRQIVAVKGHREQLEVSRSYLGLFKGM